MQTVHVSEPWFGHLVAGTKTVEGRKASPKWKDLKVGQELILTNGLQECLFKVTYVHEYAGLKEYLEQEGLDRALPGINSLDEGVRIYEQFSTPEELAQYKFLGIGMQPV